MLIRVMILAGVLLSGAAQAADIDSPLKQDIGKYRPLVIFARTSADPTLKTLKENLEEQTTQQRLKDRKMVLYTVEGLSGKRDGKNLEQPETMALIRGLSVGVINSTQVLVFGKDGQPVPLPADTHDLNIIFSAIDNLPAQEKEYSRPEDLVTPPDKAKKGKGETAVKASRPAKAPQPMDD